MRVIIGCEFSGIVREEFKARGHDAWSCDLLPTEIPGQHIQGDILEVLKREKFDLGIFHPPCTYISVAGMCNKVKDYRRIYDMLKGAKFFMDLWFSNINKICIENPVGIMSTLFRIPDQYIEPYYFGEKQKKKTGLWLKNLPLVYWSSENDLFYKKTSCEKPEPANIRKSGMKKGMKEYFSGSFYHLPFQERSKLKSITFKSIARAMATQWG